MPLSPLTQCLKHRYKELPIWLGIPILGIFNADLPPFSFNIFLLFSALIFSMSYVLLFNDWGDLIRNPHEINHYQEPRDPQKITKCLITYSLLAVSISLILFFLISKLLAALALVGVLISALYSHPSIHLKENFLMSKILHIVGGEIQFLIGFLYASSSLTYGLLIGFFFSLIFTAGHFIHECVDLKEDLAGSIKTGATRFGIKANSIAALVLFFLAHFYAAGLAYANILPWITFFIFLPPIILHIAFSMYILKNININLKNIKNYKKAYRLVYALCTVIFLAFKIQRYL